MGPQRTHFWKPCMPPRAEGSSNLGGAAGPWSLEICSEQPPYLSSALPLQPESADDTTVVLGQLPESLKCPSWWCLN